MTAEQQEAGARRKEAERLGRVAVHSGQQRDSCPYDAGEFRDLWLKGFDETTKRGIRRLDMSRARGTGFRAFQDGLKKDECPYSSRSQDRSEWLDGWERAREAQEKRDAETYR